MAADKNTFRQFVSICKEIDDEEVRVKKLQDQIDSMRPLEREVTDIVTRGKRGKKPLGICKIRGSEDHQELNKKRAELRERKARKELSIAQREKGIIEAEEFIYSLEESETRRILLFYCIDGIRSWKGVAEAMGEGYTADMCKQAFSRFMRAN